MPGDPGAIARAAVYLAGDDAAFVHGITLDVDGGRGHVAVLSGERHPDSPWRGTATPLSSSHTAVGTSRCPLWNPRYSDEGGVPVAVRRALGWVPLLAVTLVLAACGGRADPVGVTESEAYERVDSYVRRAVMALPDAKLEQATSPASGPCRGEPRDRVVVRNSYWIRGVVGENGHFDAFVRWWEDNGFEVLRDLRPARHYVWVENPADGFRMSLRDDGTGELLLGAESPCVAAG